MNSCVRLLSAKHKLLVGPTLCSRLGRLWWLSFILGLVWNLGEIFCLVEALGKEIAITCVTLFVTTWQVFEMSIHWMDDWRASCYMQLLLNTPLMNCRCRRRSYQVLCLMKIGLKNDANYCSTFECCTWEKIHFSLLKLLWSTLSTFLTILYLK